MVYITQKVFFLIRNYETSSRPEEYFALSNSSVNSKFSLYEDFFLSLRKMGKNNDFWLKN